MKLNKKAVSGVVTVVLLILLVIAAVGILWAVISNFTEDSTESVGTSAICLATQLEIVDANATANQIVVKRTYGSGELSGIKVFVVETEVTGYDGNVLAGQEKTITVTSIAGNKIEVAAVVDGQACAIADSAIAFA